MATNLLPNPAADQNYVTAHALSAGFLTLPEYLFVQPSVEGNCNTVPSLSFLIQHQNPGTGILTRIVFDLGLRRKLDDYPAPMKGHLISRRPITTVPDVKESLEKGGLKEDGIDCVILSHVHWDHVGTPSDFTKAQFVVGPGSLDVLASGVEPSASGSHQFFEPDLLPKGRAIELPRPESHAESKTAGSGSIEGLSNAKWQRLAHFEHAIDVFSDGSVHIINAPGHLPGHINLLARLGPEKWLYLAGDASHDRRILRKELDTAVWEGPLGETCCIHVDKNAADATIEKIRTVEKDKRVEFILAHDSEWVDIEENKQRFWPGKL